MQSHPRRVRDRSSHRRPADKRVISARDHAWAKAAGLRYVTGEGPGIARRRRGSGFAYIGADSKPVRDSNTLSRIRALVIPPAWQDVWICPSENGHIQAVGRDARGRKQYRYHPGYREIRDQNKFGRMAAFGAVLPKIRGQVEKDLSLPGLPKRKVVATIVSLLDQTCIRVGNEEYAKSNHTFGLTTLRDGHVEVHGDAIHLHFHGKSHQQHDILLHDRKLSKIVKRCQDLPGQELFQYQEDSGQLVKVDSSDINEYLREMTEADFTAKDFRTWHGTGYVADQLTSLGPAASQTEAKRNIVAAVRETAKHLGNRPAACRKYYIHPAIFDCYLDQSIFDAMRRSTTTLHHASGELAPSEVAVLRLIESYAAAR